MAESGYFVDAMLLVLLVVGRTDTRIIDKHRNLGHFSTNDFETLLNLVDGPDRVVWVTPNTLTEASNLLGQHGSPEREQLFDTLSSLINESQEVLVQSTRAAESSRFRELGLSDCALLSVVSKERPLLTTDGTLYIAALTIDSEASVNFNHHRLEEAFT